MATTTFNSVGFGGSANNGLNFKSFFSNAFNRYIEARSKAAMSQVDNYLQSLSENSLAELNFSAEEIKKLKEGQSLSKIR